MRNGSFSMHAVDDSLGVTVGAPPAPRRPHQPLLRQLVITPLDAPLVSPGQPRVLPNVLEPPDMSHGVSFNLHNQLWGTNYVAWLPYQHTREGGGGGDWSWGCECRQQGQQLTQQQSRSWWHSLRRLLLPQQQQQEAATTAGACDRLAAADARLVAAMRDQRVAVFRCVAD
jgi:hypothetical protein